MFDSLVKRNSCEMKEKLGQVELLSVHNSTIPVCAHTLIYIHIENSIRISISQERWKMTKSENKVTVVEKPQCIVNEILSTDSSFKCFSINNPKTKARPEQEG